MARVRLRRWRDDKSVSMSMGPRIAAEQAMTCSCCWCRGCLLRGRTSYVAATKLPPPYLYVDEPLQVEAAEGGMIGKSKGTRAMACPVWEMYVCRYRCVHTAAAAATARRRVIRGGGGMQQARGQQRGHGGG